MITKTVIAAAFVSIALAGHGYAQEGNGDPFGFRADAQVTRGPAIVADVGSQAYPLFTGNTVRESSLAALEPAFGSEAPIQTMNALPRGAGEGTVAYAQAQSLNRYWAARSPAVGTLVAGQARRRG